MTRIVKSLAVVALAAAGSAAVPAAAQTVAVRGDKGTEHGWYGVPLKGGKLTPIAVGSPGSPTGPTYGAHGAGWAPNGKTLVLKPEFTNPATGEWYTALTAVGAPAGTPSLQLTRDFSIPDNVSVSPDSRAVAFVGQRWLSNTWTTGIFKVPLAGGPVVELTPPGTESWLNGVSWSPDGRWVAYLREVVDPATGGTVGQLAIVPAAGGTPVPLLDGPPVDNIQQSWSPDSRRIATAAGDVLLVDVATRAATPLTAGRSCRHPTFSPDGRFVAAVCARPWDGPWELLVFPASGSDPAAPPAPIAVDVTPWGNQGLSWTPASDGIVYVTDNGRGWNGVTLVSLEGVPLELVPEGVFPYGISTVMVQPAVPPATVQIVGAKTDHVARRITVDVWSPVAGCADEVTLLGYGRMTTCNRSTKRWSATAPAPTPWASVGACGRDGGCAYLP